LVLGGTEHLNIRVPATDVLPISEMEPFEFAGQFKPDTQVSLQKNSTCSPWLDLVDLVSSQDLDVLDRAGEDATEAFLVAMAGVKDTLSTAGISWRWMLAAKADGSGLELQLQGMPCTGTAIQSIPLLTKDNVAVIVLARFTVEADCFDGEQRAGPIPRFFTTSPGEVAALLRNNPAVAHTYCQMLVSRIIVPEELTSLECMGYAQGPRQGKGESPFVREWVVPRMEQPSKKLRAGQLGSSAEQPAGAAGPVGDSQGITQLEYKLGL
jgi:hypothetical protein